MPGRRAPGSGVPSPCARSLAHRESGGEWVAQAAEEAVVATRKIAEHICLELNLFRQHEKRLPTTWSKTSGSTNFLWHPEC